MIEHRDVDLDVEHGRPDGGANGGAKQLPGGPEARKLPPPAQGGAPRLRRGRRGLLWLLVLAVIGYAAYRYYQASEAKQAAAQAAQAARAATRAASVAAAAARRGDIPVYLRGLGTVAAYNTVNVKTRADGPLISVNFREGQFVNQGDLLAVVDPRPTQVALEQAEGNLARDEAQMKDAQANLARYQKLWDEGVIARQQLDTQAAQVGQFQGAIAVDQANIDNARLNLSFTRIEAPISGRIGLRMVDIHPITILSTLPSAGVGALLALLLTHQDLNVIALIGIILLIGIVKKNAIMMIDFALEAERQEGRNSRDAIYEACLLRFRPIMMTTMAAMLGGVPLAVGGGVGSELRRPLGITIVGGLIVSQMLTLYTTPVIYLYLDRFRQWVTRMLPRRSPRPCRAMSRKTRNRPRAHTTLGRFRRLALHALLLRDRRWWGRPSACPGRRKRLPHHFTVSSRSIRHHPEALLSRDRRCVASANRSLTLAAQ
jgi:hypothetical protein